MSILWDNKSLKLRKIFDLLKNLSQTLLMVRPRLVDKDGNEGY